jgi:hypothetical protein
VSDLWRNGRWLVLGGALVGLAAWGLSLLGSPEVPREALDAAPAGASLVARVDGAALTASHVWRAIVGEDEAENGGRRVGRVCGYDPLDEVDDATVFVFGSPRRPFEHIGFVARGELARGAENRQRLMSCVSRVVGGGGAMQRVEIEGEPAIASSTGESHAAFLGSDGIVGGDRAVVARVVRVARGDEPPARSDATLSRLWARVSHDRDIVAVAHLPERWIPALRRMSRSLHGELGALAAVRAIGVGVRVRDGLSIGVAAETARASDADRLVELVHEQVDAILEEPLAQISVVGRALRRIEVESQAREVVLTVSLSNAQLDALLSLWHELRAAVREADDAQPAADDTRSPSPPSEPEEAAPDAGAEAPAPNEPSAAGNAPPTAPSVPQAATEARSRADEDPSTANANAAPAPDREPPASADLLPAAAPEN